MWSQPELHALHAATQNSWFTYLLTYLLNAYAVSDGGRIKDIGRGTKECSLAGCLKHEIGGRRWKERYPWLYRHAAENTTTINNKASSSRIYWRQNTLQCDQRHGYIHGHFVRPLLVRHCDGPSLSLGARFWCSNTYNKRVTDNSVPSPWKYGGCKVRFGAFCTRCLNANDAVCTKIQRHQRDYKERLSLLTGVISIQCTSTVRRAFIMGGGYYAKLRSPAAPLFFPSDDVNRNSTWT